MTKAEKIAKDYLNGEPVDLIDIIPELLGQIRMLSGDRKGWKKYINNLQKAIDHHNMVEERKVILEESIKQYLKLHNNDNL